MTCDFHLSQTLHGPSLVYKLATLNDPPTYFLPAYNTAPALNCPRPQPMALIPPANNSQVALPPIVANPIALVDVTNSSEYVQRLTASKRKS